MSGVGRGRRALNIPEPMVGYAQLSRTVERPDQLWQSLVGAAARHGGYLERFVYDLDPAETMAQPSDSYVIARLPTWVADLATQGGKGSRASIPNPVFWKLVADLFESGGVVVTPSADHLAFLGTAEESVLQWLSQSHPSAIVLFADTDPVPDRPDLPISDSIELRNRGRTR